ncbi:MAG TPA: hypothetical protein VL501_02525 [Pyrinomonadaceae bacterium]|nr:hypothetical protein [Pyrinomonadaceae bacterium]
MGIAYQEYYVVVTHTDIDFYFLLFSLFLPRLVLLIYILFIPNAFPVNTVPQWADILLGAFFPRILILIYIYQNMGYETPWFWVHLVVAIMAYLGGSRETRRRQIRRRSVVID